MTIARVPQLVVDLTAWPGVVLRISRDGVILGSNGRLERLLDRAEVVRGRVADLLDGESSGAKWDRIAGAAPSVDGAVRWELMFRSDARILDPRAFTVLRSAADDELWLVEHPADPRLTQLSDDFAQMNSELSTAQRRLMKEQQRLAHALAEVERSNAALDEFAHAVSHDLKAPLRAIIDYAELLSQDIGASLDTEHAGYLDRLAVLSRRMRAMIDAVLGFARAGRESSAPERVETGALVREIVDFLAPPPDVRVEIAPTLPVLEIRRVPFEQVLRNLIGNAIKYRRAEHAWVRIDAARVQGCWEFVVSDNGRGIAPEQQEQIWRLFLTTDPQEGESSGIGLALVKRIVESEGGRVRVESVQNEGSHFHVLWPAAGAPGQRLS